MVSQAIKLSELLFLILKKIKITNENKILIDSEYYSKILIGLLKY